MVTQLAVRPEPDEEGVRATWLSRLREHEFRAPACGAILPGPFAPGSRDFAVRNHPYHPVYNSIPFIWSPTQRLSGNEKQATAGVLIDQRGQGHHRATARRPQLSAPLCHS
jgi:hypothetical protein